jgi:hypothetical protein
MAPDRFDAFLKAIGTARPSISLRDFASRVAEALDQESADVYELLVMIAGAYAALDGTGVGVDEFVDDVCESEKATDSESLTEIKDWVQASTRLRSVLSLPNTVGLSAKALSVISESERTYCNARIISDLRPIFRADDVSKVSASVVMHSLRIAFHKLPSNETENFFTTLVTEDLLNLKEVIDRAIAKDEALRGVASTSNIPALDFRVEEED